MIELKHVSKTFDSDSGGVDALKDVSLTIEDGDIYGIIGMSGAGKSTLVRCINLLEKPTAGEVVVDGQRLDTMTPAQLRAARREITMIFQRFNLLMQRTCLQNVCFPMELSGREEGGRRPAGPRSCWSWWACRIRRRPIRRSCPAASSSASPLPVRWLPSPRCCCATRPPVLWIPTPPTRSWS